MTTEEQMKYLGWAIIWAANGQIYFASVAHLLQLSEQNFLKVAEAGFLTLNVAEMYEYHSGLGMNEHRNLTRQTMVLPVDTLLGAGKIYVKVTQAVLFCEMNEDDREHYSKLVKAGEDIRKNTLTERSPIKVATKLPPDLIRG